MDTTNQKTHTPPTISPTLAINQQMNRLEAAGKEVYRFGFGQSPFPVPELVVKALQANAARKDYLPTAGLDLLRERVATHFSKRLSVPYRAENVMIGPGSKELIFLAQWVSESTVLLPSPSWVSYGPQAKMLGKEAVWLKTTAENAYRLSASTLATYCQQNPDAPKLLILNSPNNPTGQSYPTQELEALATVAREYGVIVLSDEIYGALDFADQHQSIARFYPEGTLVTEGLSKWCGAGGWRLGLILIPDELAHWRNRMIELASETFSCVSTPIQYAAATAYEPAEDIHTYQKHCRQILRCISDYISTQLNSVNIHTLAATGGFYVFPNFSLYKSRFKDRTINNSPDLCRAILNEAGVALLPGTAFGQEPEQLTTRLAFVDFDGAVALDWCAKNGSDQLGFSFLENCCPKIVKGTTALLSWTEKF